MKLAADPGTAAWLATLPIVEWDAGNVTKSETKHRITALDVEAMLVGPTLFAGRILEPAHEEPRWLVLGRGRNTVLALVFTRRGNLLRPISCRRARTNERRLYVEAVGE